MCGRYTSTSTVEDLVKVFEVEEVRTEQLPLRYNVAPTLDVYAVANRSSDKGPRRTLGTFRWGLVPSWSKSATGGPKMINARAEGIETKPAYRSALARRRCLIPADAFYEWQRRTTADGRPAGKLPYAIRLRHGQPMAFAGLWEVWRDPEDEEGDLLRTCTIVTTRANDVMAPIHDRMPVVLDPTDWSTWLDRDVDAQDVMGLLVPPPSDWFDVFPVSSLVSNVSNEGPELLEPLLDLAPSDFDGLPGLDDGR
jgi:putative SOS response-associated peptidase YedK